jgi:hypothetical protein
MLLRILAGTPPTGYNVELIIITACVMLVYFGLIEASALWEKRKAQNAIEVKVPRPLSMQPRSPHL